LAGQNVTTAVPSVSLGWAHHKVLMAQSHRIRCMLVAAQGSLAVSLLPYPFHDYLHQVVEGLCKLRSLSSSLSQIHLAGKEIETYFTDAASTDKVALSCGPGAWRRSDGWLHGARKAFVRAQSYVIPYNPGITAREALALPFFSPKQAQDS